MGQKNNQLIHGVIHGNPMAESKRYLRRAFGINRDEKGKSRLRPLIYIKNYCLFISFLLVTPHNFWLIIYQ